MPKLNEIKGITEKTKKKSAKEIPSLELLECQIAKYNAAADRLKAARKEMDYLAPELLVEGLSYVFRHNCTMQDDTKKQIKSVNLVEPQRDGSTEAIQFTWSSRVLKIDQPAVAEFFKTLTGNDGRPVDINKYAEWVIGADFDKKVFNNGNGRFDQKRFDKFKADIQATADELGVENPLSFYKEFKATADLNDIRFQELNYTQNLALHAVLPTGTSLEPIRSNEEGE
jgi:hypothetical protein